MLVTVTMMASVDGKETVTTEGLGDGADVGHGQVDGNLDRRDGSQNWQKSRMTGIFRTDPTAGVAKLREREFQGITVDGYKCTKLVPR
eukprot:1177043-Prorocentrum_minimum.AAC.2